MDKTDWDDLAGLLADFRAKANLGSNDDEIEAGQAVADWCEHHLGEYRRAAASSGWVWSDHDDDNGVWCPYSSAEIEGGHQGAPERACPNGCEAALAEEVSR